MDGFDVVFFAKIKRLYFVLLKSSPLRGPPLF
jgi:hypothetical protein